MKELTESASLSAFRTRYEAGRSFDLEDDLEFCPGLLTDDDVSFDPNKQQACSMTPFGSRNSPLDLPVVLLCMRPID